MRKVGQTPCHGLTQNRRIFAGLRQKLVEAETKVAIDVFEIRQLRFGKRENALAGEAGRVGIERQMPGQTRVLIESGP